MQGKFKVGDRVVIKDGPLSFVGGQFILSRIDNSDSTLKFWLDEHTKTTESNWFRLDQVEHVTEKEEYLTKQKQQLTDQIKLIDAKIQWIKESGSDVYDGNQFRVWQVLTLADDKSISKLEKVKAISELIK